MVSHDVKYRRKRERALWRNALLASFLLHLCVYLFSGSVPIPLPPFAAAGPRAGDDQAAQGMKVVGMAARASRTITPPREPVIADIEVAPLEVFEDEPSFDLETLLGERPGDEGPQGLEEGVGEGDGGTAEVGRNRLVPPVPRGMIIPPTNRKLRGTQVQVWVFVNEAGRVVPDSTRLDPPTSDRGFNKRLVDEAAGWVFAPATRDGQQVASWFPYTISM